MEIIALLMMWMVFCALLPTLLDILGQIIGLTIKYTALCIWALLKFAGQILLVLLTPLLEGLREAAAIALERLVEFIPKAFAALLYASREAVVFIAIFIDEWRKSRAGLGDNPFEGGAQEDVVDDTEEESAREDAQDEAEQEPGPKPGPRDRPRDPVALAMARLGVSAPLSGAALTKAYRDKIKRAHPDAGGSHEEAAAINAAYALLKTRCAA